jgi:hypothetical protein
MRGEFQMLRQWAYYLKIVFIVAMSLALPLSAAMSQELSWTTIRIKGEGTSAACSPNSVLTAYNGNSAAFVFTNLGIKLDAAAPHQSGSEFGACRIRSRVVIPKGYYLYSIAQNTQAGVVKSVGAKGVIHAMLALQSTERFNGMRTPAFPGLNSDGTVIERSLKFAPKDEMNEPLLNLNGNYQVTRQAMAYQCQFTKKAPASIDIEFRTAVRGQRKKPGSSVVISVDSADVQLLLGAKLVACP